jgi:hypothetical protein
MTQVTVGPPWAADGPLPVAPPHNLLSIPGILLPPAEDEHWLVGIEEWPYPRDLPDALDPCLTGTFRLKNEGEGWNLPIFGPFTAYLPITCSSITAARPGFAERAILAFQAKEAYAVAHEIAWGTAQPLNPYLSDGNVNLPAGSTALRPDVGLAYLEDAIGATALPGLIHATPAVATAWNGANGYEIEDKGGTLYTTANMTPVAVSYAYHGVTPSGGTAAGATEQWVFASSMLQVRRQSDVQLIAPTLKESMDRSINLVTFRAERGYVAVFDAPDSSSDTRPVQAAVKIDWSL